VRRAVVAEEDRDDPPELDASEIGRQVHALLAGQEVASPAVEAIHLARRFEESDLGQRAKKARSSEREWDFMLAVGDMVLRGQVDLWFEERGGPVIVDYKTDDIEAWEAEAHAAAYALQLRYYALAVEGATGAAPREAWLYFARPDVAVEVSLGAEDLDAARDLVEQLASAQSTLEFPLREGTHCSRCPFYRGKCPAA
jgi:ATP-dependent exoDNAse (exonuclease V) beta subunit